MDVKGRGCYLYNEWLFLGGKKRGFFLFCLRHYGKSLLLPTIIRQPPNRLFLFPKCGGDEVNDLFACTGPTLLHGPTLTRGSVPASGQGRSCAQSGSLPRRRNPAPGVRLIYASNARQDIRYYVFAHIRGGRRNARSRLFRLALYLTCNMSIIGISRVLILAPVFLIPLLICNSLNPMHARRQCFSPSASNNSRRKTDLVADFSDKPSTQYCRAAILQTGMCHLEQIVSKSPVNPALAREPGSFASHKASSPTWLTKNTWKISQSWDHSKTNSFQLPFQSHSLSRKSSNPSSCAPVGPRNRRAFILQSLYEVAAAIRHIN